MQDCTCKRLPLFPFSALGLVVWTFVGQFLIGCDDSPASPPTDPDAQIVLTSPKGGETFKVGTTVRIKWKLQGKGLDEVDGVNIEVSPDSGRSWVGLVNRSIGPDDSSWGDFGWPVPASLVHLGKAYALAGNSQLMARVMQYSTGDSNKIAVTRKPFSVAAP